jgi:hypothetical protein
MPERRFNPYTERYEDVPERKVVATQPTGIDAETIAKWGAAVFIVISIFPGILILGLVNHFVDFSLSWKATLAIGFITSICLGLLLWLALKRSTNGSMYAFLTYALLAVLSVGFLLFAFLIHHEAFLTVWRRLTQ